MVTRPLLFGYNTLKSTISTSLNFKDEIEITTSFDNLMEEDANVVLELTRLASNIKKEVCLDFEFFPFFYKKI
jgi:hypothetical protein